MEGNCPHCQVRLNFPVSGEYHCERCQARFTITVEPPPAAMAAVPGVEPFQTPPVEYAPPPTPAWAPSAPTLQAPCAGHPDNPAAQVCERCGDFMCRLCTTVVEGRAYCPKCFDLLYSRGALSFTQKQFTLPGVTLTLGIVALLSSGCALLGLPLGIAGVVTGLRALKEHRARPDLPKRGLTVAGLWISGISVVLCIAATAVFTWAIIKNP